MNKQTEALKLALEALEVATTPLAKDRQEVLRAQAAIREALAEQPAQQQEPVAWVTGLHAGRCVIKTLNPAAILPVGIALYTSPPAQRPWVGLTNEEIDALYEAHHDQYGECETPGFGYECAIEAKLREKNA